VDPITTADPLADFTCGPFSADGFTLPVYRQGRGRSVVLLHELPGITPETAGLGRRIAARGFTVWMPSLCGEPGRPFSNAYVAAETARLCVRREFRLFAARASSPITRWLRALCRRAHAHGGGPGVGVIGMCLTGNFALALMADPAVIAPVASQPSLPFIGADALHVSADELVAIKQRGQAGVTLLGLRFSGDRLCPKRRFDRLSRELGPAFESIEIDSSRGNPFGHRPLAHSVLTFDLIDREGQPTREALERVLAFLQERVGVDGVADGVTREGG
jgi:dienelactone hydrolase